MSCPVGLDLSICLSNSINVSKYFRRYSNHMSDFRKGPQQPDEQGGHLLKTIRKIMLGRHGGLETIRKTIVKKKVFAQCYENC